MRKRMWGGGLVVWGVMWIVGSLPVAAQDAPLGLLENPRHGSVQSGLGLISGWVCDADEITAEITTDTAQRHTYTIAYGTARTDTRRYPDGRRLCGDTDNGFGLLINWNLLDDGIHELVVSVDGEELGRSTFGGGDLRDGIPAERPTHPLHPHGTGRLRASPCRSGGSAVSRIL